MYFWIFQILPMIFQILFVIYDFVCMKVLSLEQSVNTCDHVFNSCHPSSFQVVPVNA